MKFRKTFTLTICLFATTAWSQILPDNNFAVKSFQKHYFLDENV